MAEAKGKENGLQPFVKGDPYKFVSSDGNFKRQISSFRSWISTEPGAQFPPEKDRYVSYISGTTCIS